MSDIETEDLNAVLQVMEGMAGIAEQESQRADAAELQVQELRVALAEHQAFAVELLKIAGVRPDLIERLQAAGSERGQALLAVVEAARDLVEAAADVGGEGPMPFAEWKALCRAVRALVGRPAAGGE